MPYSLPSLTKPHPWGLLNAVVMDIKNSWLDTEYCSGKGKELSEAHGFLCMYLCPCVCVCVHVCVHACYTAPQSREIRMELSHICPAAGFSDLSLKHLVLASIRDRILTLVPKQVWQFPYFQALDTRLFPSREWLIFLGNTDSQMPLLHSLLLLIQNFSLKVKG